MKKMTERQVEMMDEVSSMGGKVWDRYNKSRTYMTCDILNKLSKKQGGLGQYDLNDQNNKIFLDNLTGLVMRSFRGKNPTVELDLN